MDTVFDINEIIERKKSINDNYCNMVYFLLKENEVVYVGKTIFGLKRIMEHIEKKEKDFDSFSFFFVEKNNLNKIELDNINYYKPKYNKYAGGEYSFSRRFNCFIKKEKTIKKRKKYDLYYNNKKYKNMTALAKKLNMSVSGVSRIIKRGGTFKGGFIEYYVEG